MNTDVKQQREGGCLCGAVRYTVDWPPQMIGTCQCTNCQKQSGSAVSVVAIIPHDSIQISGDLTNYEDTGDSGLALSRRFCAVCGSPILSESVGMQAAGIRILKTGTLDDRSGLSPSVHFWTRSGQDWFALPESGHKMERQ
jgi:hypothetical protein